jgi:DNA invertase Pin-like site-specific DNA recombinase
MIVVNQERRGALYVRMSASQQERSLLGQLQWAIQRAKSEGIALNVTEKMLDEASLGGLHEIGDLFVDEAVTGADMNRPGLQAFLGRLRSDASITHGFVWSRNRVSRSAHIHEPMAMESSLMRAGKVVIFSDGPHLDPASYRDDPFRFALEQVIGYGRSSEYRSDLSKSVLRGQALNARKGFWVGGGPPFGFVRVAFNTATGERRQLTGGELGVGSNIHVVVLPGEDEASRAALEIVVEIHKLYQSGLWGIKAIANELNRRGVPSPQGGRRRGGKLVRGKWSATTVATLLEQPVYAGWYAWGRRSEGSLFRFDATSPQSYRHTLAAEHDENGYGRKHVKRDWREWLLVDPAVPYEPIVTPEVWRANVERLRSRGEAGGRRGVPRRRGGEVRYPLRVMCGECGAAMVGCPYQGRLTYKCSTYLGGDRKACTHNWADVEIVVPFALEALKSLVLESANKPSIRRALREMHVERASAQGRGPSELSRLEHEIHDREEERKRVANGLWVADADLAADAKSRWEQLAEEVRSLRERARLVARAESVPAIDIEEETERALATLSDLHGYLDELPTERLAEVFQAFGVVVVLNFERRKVGRRDIVPTKATVLFQGEADAGTHKRAAAQIVPNLVAAPVFDQPLPTTPASVKQQTSSSKDGRGERIRTSDLFHPKEAR